MRIPTKEQCELLLSKYNFPEKKRRHVELVMRVAEILAARCKAQGVSINIDLVVVGGLFHDIDKGVEEAGKIHPQKGVEILKAEGYPEVARICETHTINAFLDPKTAPSTWEEKCVALADKMVKNEVIGVEERYRGWREECNTEMLKALKTLKENRGNAEVLENWERQREIVEQSYPLVKKLEEEILGMIGMKADEIKKLLNCSAKQNS